MSRAHPRTINDKYELVATRLLETHPDNPRRGNLAQVVESIATNGLFGALVVNRRTRQVLAGNHRLLAARELGMEKVPVVWVDVGDEQALRILVADNRTSDLASYDEAKLGEALEALRVAGELSGVNGLEGTGFDHGDLTQLLAKLHPQEGEGWRPEDEWNDMPAFHQDDLRPATQVLISFTTAAQKVELGKLLGQEWTEKTKSAWWPPQERNVFADKCWSAAAGHEPGEGEGER